MRNLQPQIGLAAPETNRQDGIDRHQFQPPDQHRKRPDIHFEVSFSGR